MDKVETVAPSITGSSIPNTSVVDNVIGSTVENTSSLLEQIYNNKTYVYILVVVLVLAGIGIYLYLNQSTNKSKNDKSKDDKSKDDKSKDDKAKDDKAKDDKSKEEVNEQKDLLNPNKDYYLVDPSGKTILVNKYFPKILQSEMQENQMVQQQIIQQQQRIKDQMMQQQMMQQQMVQQQMVQQQMTQPIMVNNQIGMPSSGQNRVIQTQQMPSQRPKLSHPGESAIPDVDLDEDDNIANQDLTQDEIDELKKQLEVMQRKQSAPITAENEGNTDAEF
jgi:hypothetical protein